MVVWITPVLRTESVSMYRLGSLLFTTAVQYTVAHLIAIHVPESGHVRLSEHYEAVRRPAMYALMFFFTLPIVSAVSAGIALPTGVLVNVAALVLVAGVSSRVERPAVQTGLAVVFGLLYVGLSALANRVGSPGAKSDRRRIRSPDLTQAPAADVRASATSANPAIATISIPSINGESPGVGTAGIGSTFSAIRSSSATPSRSTSTFTM